ncbi:F-box protein At5g07610-like [Rhododendron vialii]|uniref:F-box protein At5g07610-like n=1 Tax=Rhododendron vialii TaxID=182163 RepID=UPI00265DC01B|nr:F-box protein At5g07610-like [Rhododendron vialii]
MTMKTSREETKPIADGTPPQTSPAADLIANNFDVLTQILLRLPAKSLIRFKSVSKHWFSLLSDSQFASAHSRLNPKPLISSFYFYYNERLESVSLNGSPTLPSLSFLRHLTGDYTILQSCNGLLSIKNVQLVDDCVEAQYIVCNPITQKFHLLARPGGDCDESCCLAFDPSKSPHYKVVFLVWRLGVSFVSLEMDIYSSETACWKNISSMDKFRKILNGAFWNGAIYWLCDQYNLLRFDVETEKVMMIPYMPSSSSGRILSPYNTRYFGECGWSGRLLLIQSQSHFGARLKIWEMDKDYCRWNVKFHVDLKTLIAEFPEMGSKTRCKFTLMGVVEGEKEDDFVLILAIPGRRFVIITVVMVESYGKLSISISVSELIQQSYCSYTTVDRTVLVLTFVQIGRNFLSNYGTPKENFRLALDFKSVLETRGPIDNLVFFLELVSSNIYIIDQHKVSLEVEVILNPEED